MRRVLFPLCMLLSCGEPFEASMAKVCNAPSFSGADKVAPEDKARTMGQWLLKNVKNDEVKALVKDMARLSPADRAKLVREGATRAGIEPCPCADYWAAEAL